MNFAGTFWSLVPPLIAITLALITKEVYSSLFIGILCAGLLASNLSVVGMLDSTINKGLIPAVSGNAGIMIFLVVLGIIVALINKAGAARAFGRFAEKHIHTKAGALLCTSLLGVLIFIDDYFNCLTVGAVMTPVTDSKKISRAKLAYIIDATAAPVCMIAPISSWAAAVSSNVTSETMSGLELFVRAIPFNLYSLLTLAFVVMLSILGFDYGKMRKSEYLAESGNLGALSETDIVEADITEDITGNGRISKFRAKIREKVHFKRYPVGIFDMIIPIVILIAVCVVTLIYVGGYFDASSECYHDFISAFANTDAGSALALGGVITLIFVLIYSVLRGIISAKEGMDCFPEGFKSMVPAILILTFACALKNLTSGEDALNSAAFVKSVMDGASGTLQALLPAIIFIVGCIISFATGTSWGTFGILIPIVSAIFSETDPLMFVAISACLAGAVCGDHCSPISDTTIMSSAGANCDHVEHVSTQLPYALTVAGFSLVGFIFAGFCPKAYIVLPVMLVLMFLFLVFMKKFVIGKKNEA